MSILHAEIRATSRTTTFMPLTVVERTRDGRIAKVLPVRPVPVVGATDWNIRLDCFLSGTPL